MDIKLLKKECDRLVREYAEKLGNPDVSVEENKKLITWKIYLKTINLAFSYTLKNSSLIPVSTLFCSVYLQKNAEVPYNLNQVIDYLDVEKKLLPQIEKVYNGEIRHIDSYEK